MHICMYMLNYVKIRHGVVCRGGIELYTLIKVNQLKYIMEKLTSLCYNIITHNYHMSNLLS
jgi:hypothetical protein